MKKYSVKYFDPESESYKTKIVEADYYEDDTPIISFHNSVGKLIWAILIDNLIEMSEF